MSSVQFRRVHKLFGSVVAVEDLDLHINDGEFLAVLGPSGCGKTTSLRMLAGFERPTYGDIALDEQIVNTIGPSDRNVAMVFQSYALYPHMTVYKNLAFGMKVRHERRAVIKRRVSEVAAILGIEELLKRKPAALSGGERQRVALGRALLREPRAFLMDEPLSNLDAALRVQMRVELKKRLRERLGVTTMYVTHDQVEAMTMGDRIAIMNFGRLLQVDTPERLFACPATVFVAKFVGSPAMNLEHGELTSIDGRPGIEWLGTRIPLDGPAASAVGDLSHREVIVGVRASDLRWAEEAPPSCTVSLSCEVDVVEPLGTESYIYAQRGGVELISRFPARSGVGPGARVELALDPHHLHLFDARTKENVLLASGLPTSEMPAAISS